MASLEGCAIHLGSPLTLLYNARQRKLTFSFSQLQIKLAPNNPITVYSVLLSTVKMQLSSWPLLYLLV